MKRKHLLLTLLLALFLPWAAMAQNECPVVTGLNVNDVTSNGATIVWDDNGDDDFTIMAGEMDFTNYYLFDFLGDQFPVVLTHSDPNYGFVKAYDDGDCAKSNNGGHHSTTAEMVLDVTIPIESSLSFNARVSSEQDYDKAYFSIDGTVQEQLNGISGEGIWCAYDFTLPAGLHTLRWYYVKDVSVDDNDDCFYVTDISISSYVVNEWNSYEQAHSPYTITDLATSTEYYVKVIRNCTDGSHSSDGYVGSFTTLPCQPPTGLTIDNVTNNYVYYHFDSEPGAAYQYTIAPSNTTYTEEQLFQYVTPRVAQSTTFSGAYSMYGEDLDTDYYFYLRRKCGEDDYSATVTVLFHSSDLCADLLSNDLPYTEDFEEYIVGENVFWGVPLSECWDAYNSSIDAFYSLFPLVNQDNGAKRLIFASDIADGTVDPHDQYAILPPMENVRRLKMTLYAKSGTNLWTPFQVGVMQGKDASTFTAIGEPFATTDDYQEYNVSFENYIGNGNRIAIKMDAANAENTICMLYVDNITVELNCYAPSNLAASNITFTSADLSWTGSPADESYTVRYRTAPVYGTPAFSEGFENGLDYWEFHSGNEINGLNGDEGVHAGISDYTAHSRRYSFRFSSFRPIGEGETKQQSLYSPVFSLDAPNVFSFYCRNQMSDDNGYEILRIDYRSTDETIHTLATIYPSFEWQRYSFEIPADAKQVRFEYLDGMRFVYIDDITVSKIVASYGEWQYVNDIAVTSTTLSGLTLGTEYEAQVKSDCSDEWSQAVSFVTQGCTYPVPSTWDFEDATPGQLPQCWTRMGSSPTKPLVHNIYHFSGTQYLEFYHASPDDATLIAVMPAIDADLNTLRVEFYGKQTYGNDPAFIQVGYVTDLNDPESYGHAKTFYMTDTPAKYTAFFNNAPTDGYIVFKTSYLNQNFAIVIDDVTVKELGCEAVTNLQVTETGSNSITLDWDGQDDAEFYIYYLNQTTQESMRTPGTVRPPYTLEGLSSNTSYQIEVTAECNVVNSNPADPNLVATLQVTTQPCAAPTGLAVNNVTAATADLSWTSSPSADSYRVAYRTAAVGGDTLLVEQGFENGMDVWLIGQQLNNNPTCAGIAAEAKRSGDYGFKLAACEGTYQAGQPSDALLFTTPDFDQPTVLKFYYKKGTASSSAYLVFLYYTEQHGNQPQYLIPTDNWQSYTVELPDDVYGIEIDYVPTDEAPSASVYIDDITFTPLAQAEGEWQYVENIEITSHTLTDLTVNTEYEAKVLSDCTTPDLWTLLLHPSVFFTTTMGCTYPLPYTWDFDDDAPGTLPLCWTRLGTSSSSVYPQIQQIIYHSPYHALEFWKDKQDATNEIAVLPAFVTDLNTLRVVFYGKLQYGSAGSVNIGYVTDLTDASTFINVKTISMTREFEKYIVSFAEADAEGYIAFQVLYGAEAVAIEIDDVTVDEIPSCEEPYSLTLNSISNNGATFTWEKMATGTQVITYRYVCVEAGQNPDWTNASISLDNGNDENPPVAQVTGLNPVTEYDFYVRRECGNDDYSAAEIWRFVTTHNPVVISSSAGFTDDFESGNGWMFVNGAITNAWVYGSAAHNGAGSHALYISNDGNTWAYNNINAAMVYATKLFTFEETGNYNFTFDWQANGESSYDYLRVALVPSTTMLTAGTVTPNGFTTTVLPDGWIALDGGSKLNQKTTWETSSHDITVEAGTYIMVFAWRNDGSQGNPYPAAVDNVSIQYRSSAELSAGINWWSPEGEITLATLKQSLCSIGGMAIFNTQHDGFVCRDANGIWSGTLSDDMLLVPGTMYKIGVSYAATITYQCTLQNSVEVELAVGYNWIGYLGQATTIADAFGSDFVPTNGDMIINEDGQTATYQNGVWNGNLYSLQNGHGYVYYSNASTTRNLIW